MEQAPINQGELVFDQKPVMGRPCASRTALQMPVKANGSSVLKAMR